MSIFDILEGRMQELFEGNRVVSPIAFKSLAREAVHRMKRGAVRLDGRKFAPTLYTIMVSPQDDRMVAPFYTEVTGELVDFLSHEASNVGLEMADAPVVRLIADSTIKSGKFDVIAEVVPPEILAELRREEADYAAGRASGAGAGATPMKPASPMAPRRAAARRPTPVAAGPAPAATVPAAGAVREPMAPAPSSGSGACELRDLKSGQTWRLERDTVIGREQASADLVLPDSNVSRRHAQVSYDGAGWSVADLGSTNGTRVNGQRVSQSPLHTGDTLTLGLHELHFQEL